MHTPARIAARLVRDDHQFGSGGPTEYYAVGESPTPIVCSAESARHRRPRASTGTASQERATAELQRDTASQAAGGPEDLPRSPHPDVDVMR